MQKTLLQVLQCLGLLAAGSVLTRTLSFWGVEGILCSKYTLAERQNQVNGRSSKRDVNVFADRSRRKWEVSPEGVSVVDAGTGRA